MGVRSNGAPHYSRETHHVVRTREFHVSTPHAEILQALHDSHSTGTLSYDITQGGIGAIRFREEQKVDLDSENA